VVVATKTTGLEALLRDRIALVVAHRLSTIVHADKICVILNGGIAAQGRHEELLQTSPLYASLYQRRFLPGEAEAPVEADLVMPVPDSGTPAAIGFARASGIPRTAAVRTVEAFRAAVTDAIRGHELTTIVAKVEARGPATYLTDLTLLENRFQFRRYVQGLAREGPAT
jgi:hypothetical protein